MTPSARHQAVIDLLAAIQTTARPADGLASDYFRARRFIGSKDRAAIANMVYAILRHYMRLQWWLNRLSKEKPSARDCVLIYLTLVERKPVDQISSLFTGKKFAPAELANEERSFLRKLEGHTIDHPSMPDEIAVECPAWAAGALKLRFGKNFKREMEALLHAAPLDLRVNIVKATREEILGELKKAGIKAESCRLSPYGVRVEERPSLRVLPMLKTGAAEIQDEGSQLVALLVDAKPGERVLDFCAGAGGKTLAISAQMQNKGRIVASDVLANRLKRAAERFKRAGLHNIDIRPLKSETDPWIKRHKADFDRVLVDAPCSGTGTWRRNPDARWHALGPGLEKLIPLQASILTSAARLVKKGGRLVYATCSMLPEENEKQIEAFLAAHTDFRIVTCRTIWQETPCPDPYLMLTPAQH